MENTQQVFEEYIARMKKIRMLSTPPLKDIKSADEYSRVLVENFSKIGEMARENRRVIDEYIKPAIAKGSALSEEERKQLEQFSDQLLENGTAVEIDAHLSELLTELLMTVETELDGEADDSTRAIAMGKKVMRDYFIVSGLSRYDNKDLQKVRDAAIANRDELAKYLEKDAFAALSDEAKSFVLNASQKGSLLYENNIHALPEEYWSKCIAVIEECEAVFHDPFYHEQHPDFDWEAYEFRIYYYAAFQAYLVLPVETAKKVYAYAGKAAEFLENCKNEKILGAVNVESMRDLEYLASVMAKITPARDACDAYYKAYKAVDKNDHTIIGANKNLDTPSLYLCVSKMMDLELTEEDHDRYYNIEKNMLDYLYHIPKNDDLYYKCVTLFINLPLYFREVPGAMTMEEFCVSGLAATHPPTYVHVNMVARLAECMARHLMALKPELFIGFPCCSSVEDVLASKNRIINYTYKASLCHDIGKLFIIDTISMYGRALLDDEFSIIKNHPVIGAEIALEHESTREYADVIKGHHLWYDCSRGYPADFDTFKSPYKTIIDIVLAADCLDAATDTVGRSYNRGKTFSDYEKEVQDGAGTHYAPFLVELFAQPALREDIEYLLHEGRQRLYRMTFRLLKNNEAQ